MRALFRDGPAPHGGRRFTLVHEPVGAPRALVVGIAPFAEEMNKSRRTAALCAAALARGGAMVVQADLAGCGDSSGDLATASWSGWVDDVVDTVRWARSQAGEVPLWLWGIRAGCLLAGEALAKTGVPTSLLLWQPQTNGKLVLQQFLRLKMAGQLQQGAAKGVTESLQSELGQGRAVEVAGYQLGPEVALGLGAAQLKTPAVNTGAHILWLEVSAQPEPELLPVSKTTIERWQAAGADVRAAAVSGPLFWQTQDIEEAPALVEATVQALFSCEQAVPA